MTSSLVGSEMCIRDRLQSLLFNNYPLIFFAGVGCQSPGSLPWKTPPSDCLLYTSDAADDM
eukprot:12661297-Prorocentrum_lima.AAC.1